MTILRFLFLFLVSLGAVAACGADVKSQMIVTLRSGDHLIFPLTEKLQVHTNGANLQISSGSGYASLSVENIANIRYHVERETIYAPDAEQAPLPPLDPIPTPDSSGVEDVEQYQCPSVSMDGDLLVIETGGANSVEIFSAGGEKVWGSSFSERAEIAVDRFEKGTMIVRLGTGETFKIAR